MELVFWITAGLASWCLSTYLFSRLMLPLTFHATGYLHENLPSFPWTAAALGILMPQFPLYLLSFFLCMGLGRVFRVSPARVGGFAVAAGGISLYFHVMQLAGYVGHHYGGGESALNRILVGMVSLVFISPLFALMGSLAGEMLKDAAGKDRDQSF